jgi:O-acetyl-ADP-ribose deacetylase (regulator of RNase III)
MTDRPRIITGDITTLDVDAIVNAANEMLAPGGGVCGAIHAAAGPELARACAALAPCPTGDARMTAGFALPARHVIHAVGPVYSGGDAGEADLLASCYQRSLELAEEQGLRLIAFPCIGTGIFGYPRAEAAGIALRTIDRWLQAGRRPDTVVCCCFSESDAAVYREAMSRPDERAASR